MPRASKRWVVLGRTHDVGSEVTWIIGIYTARNAATLVAQYLNYRALEANLHTSMMRDALPEDWDAAYMRFTTMPWAHTWPRPKELMRYGVKYMVVDGAVGGMTVTYDEATHAATLAAIAQRAWNNGGNDE